MDRDKLRKELERVLDIMSNLDPLFDDYAIAERRFDELHKTYLAEIQGSEEQLDKTHKRQIELKRLELEERKLALEEKKADAQEKGDELKHEIELEKIKIEDRKLTQQEKTDNQKHEIEVERISIDRERNLLEDRKLDIQEETDRERNEIEREKVQVQKEELKQQAKNIRKQGWWELGKIAGKVIFAGVVNGALIVLTGRVQETSIIDSKMWSVIWKEPKV